MYPSFNARALGLTLSADETIRLAFENGFRGVDVMVRDAIEQGVDLADLRRKMDDLGLRGGAFPFPFDWRGEGDRFADDLLRLPSYAEAAASLGIARTATWVMPECPRGSDRDATLALHHDRLSLIAATLGGFGIRLGLEVIGVESSRPGRSAPFLHRMDQVEGLRRELERLTRCPIGVLADSWHLYAADEPIDHALTFGVDRIVWVHVADLAEGTDPDRAKMIDSERGLPGTHGAVASEALLAALEARGYDGPVTAEPLAKCRSLAGLSARETARKAAASLENIWPTGNGKPC